MESAILRKTFDITKIKCKFNKLPHGFVGSRIMHISNLHNCNFGKNQQHLIELTKKLPLNYIFMTGDICDEHHKKIDSALNFLEGICDMAPIYYVTGNHEWCKKDMGAALFLGMKRFGVHVLDDQMIELEKNGDCIQLIGMDDPYCPRSGKKHECDRVRTEFYIQELKHICKKRKKIFTVLLSHRPELIDFYAKAKINLVFAGHAHGGLVRIPGIGGIIAPHQGWFPRYTEGIIRKGNTKMVISRGLGNSGLFFRIRNNPEIILAVLDGA